MIIVFLRGSCFLILLKYTPQPEKVKFTKLPSTDFVRIILKLSDCAGYYPGLTIPVQVPSNHTTELPFRCPTVAPFLAHQTV
ncbi:hypothetical protein LCGC14_0673810 [marine sediment metagenome]|uniref:Uncharacterized protein n=1 Tax=marine sediment metagenome TaxID=412755 RepID=A0A0F9TY84_9ZZZZ